MKAVLNTSNKGFRLVQPVTFMASVVGSVALFAGLFPNEQRLNVLSNQRESDALSIAYLRLLVKTHPDDAPLRQALANDLSSIGKWRDARAVLTPVLGMPGEIGMKTRLEALDIDCRFVNTLPIGVNERASVVVDISHAINVLLQETSNRNILIHIADVALAYNMPGVSAEIYQKLASVDPAEGQRWHEMAAKEYLASESPSRAAQAFEAAASDVTGDRTSERKYVSLALDAHLAADAGAAALQLAVSWAPHFAADSAFLQRAFVIAVAQDNPAQARQVGRQLVQLAPRDVVLLSKQVDAELAVKDLPAALAVAIRLTAADPTNREARTRLARIAQWNGRLDIALVHWSVLARQAPNSEAMDNALRIAFARGSDSLWLGLAARMARVRKMAPIEGQELAVIQARRKVPRQLVGFLQKYVARYATESGARKMLAKEQEREADLLAGITPVKATAPPAVNVRQSLVQQSDRWSKSRKLEAGWEVLKTVEVGAGQRDTSYWENYGDLAWKRGEKSESLTAYQTAWDGGCKAARVAERLIEMSLAKEQPDRAVVYARQAYSKLGDARWMLLAMDAASQGALWDELRHLLADARSDEPKFAQSEMYWLLIAHLANHDGQHAHAREAYGQALTLNPTSVPTRIRILWLDIDSDNRQQLAHHLKEWESDASAEPAYWPAYAIGLVKLSRTDDSIGWFSKQVKYKPGDATWMLSAMDALGKAGKTDQAQGLRRDLKMRLGSTLAVAAPVPNSTEKQLLLSYATVVRDTDGQAAATDVLRNIVSRGYNDADVYEQLVGSYLSQKDFDKAKYWVGRAQADHRTLPAYQPLAVALAEKDKPAIAEILQTREKDLSIADRVGAMRQIGQRAAALQLAQKGLDEAEEESVRRLRQHRDQLKVELERRIEAGLEKKNIADLKITHGELSASVPVDVGRATVRVARNSLRSDSSTLPVPKRLNENDISAVVIADVNTDPIRFTLGANQRSDKSLLYSRFVWTHPLTARVNAGVDASFHGLTEETAALRGIGRKDRLAANLSANLTSKTFARVEVARQQFSTRDGSNLGRGSRVDGEVGTTLLEGSPAWRTRVSGSWEKNRIADRLPDNLQAAIQPGVLSVDSVLAPRFSTVGVGSTLEYGLPENRDRNVHALLDGWVGRQWPANAVAYSLRAGASVPVFDPGVLKIEAFYSNVQNGLPAQANRGVGVWYRHEF